MECKPSRHFSTSTTLHHSTGYTFYVGFRYAMLCYMAVIKGICFSVDKVLQILATLDSCKVCEGNSDERFTSLSNIHENVMMNHSSKYALVPLWTQ